MCVPCRCVKVFFVVVVVAAAALFLPQKTRCIIELLFRCFARSRKQSSWSSFFKKYFNSSPRFSIFIYIFVVPLCFAFGLRRNNNAQRTHGATEEHRNNKKMRIASFVAVKLKNLKEKHRKSFSSLREVLSILCELFILFLLLFFVPLKGALSWCKKKKLKSLHFKLAMGLGLGFWGWNPILCGWREVIPLVILFELFWIWIFNEFLVRLARKVWIIILLEKSSRFWSRCFVNCV